MKRIVAVLELTYNVIASDCRERGNLKRERGCRVGKPPRKTPEMSVRSYK